MLWLLAATVPLLVWFLWWAWRKKQTLVAQFVQSRLLAQLTVGVSQARQKIRLALIVFAAGNVVCGRERGLILRRCLRRQHKSEKWYDPSKPAHAASSSIFYAASIG